MPDKSEFNKIAETIPELKKAFNKYDEITGKNTSKDGK